MDKILSTLIISAAKHIMDFLEKGRCPEHVAVDTNTPKMSNNFDCGFIRLGFVDKITIKKRMNKMYSTLWQIISMPGLFCHIRQSLRKQAFWLKKKISGIKITVVV